MMKKVWLALLAVVLVFGLVVSCGGGGGDGDKEKEESKPFSFEGPFTEDIYNVGGSSGKTFVYDDATNSISFKNDGTTAGSATFKFVFADIGYTFNRADVLVFTYEIDVTTPEAVIVAKNPADWGADFGGDSDWGIGKGRESVLGNDTKSIYDGPKVSGTWDPATKTGTYEVLMKYLPVSATAIGFQHNSYAEFADIGKVGLNSEYTLKITKIENKVTADNKIDLPVTGLKPVTGGTPKTTVETDQFTGTVTWSPEAATFENGVVYTATINLTKTSGYTFAGIEADSFVVSGATSVTHATGTDTLAITAVFPAAATADPVVVWQPTITTATAVNANGEYLGNFGIQNTATSDGVSIAPIDGGFTISGANNNYKQINIQVGTAAGGTSYYTSEGFTAETGTDYTLTFKASVSTGTGQLRLAGNNGTLNSGQSENLTTTPRDITYSWTQDKGNFHFDTGNTTAVITITNIKITTP